jgi:hypothetical protein
MLKYLLSLLLFASLLEAATITTQQNNYNEEQAIVVSVSGMNGANNDWIGIYPAGSSNDWGNVVSWKYTLGVVNGNITLNGVPAGEYEARAFFNNSFTLEASSTFTVGVAGTSIITQKATYAPNEAITVTLSQMNGANNDWIGIYPAGASNDWGNVVSWKYTGGIINGNLILAGIPAGNYEARAFFNNSYVVEASSSFSVVAVAQTTITTSKSTYNTNEPIVVTLSDMNGANNDWVGIYPADASNDWGNVVSWRYTGGLINGNLTLDALPAGSYEVRAFFNNSFALEASHPFSVVAENLPPTIYESAENGISGNWVTTGGNYQAIYVNRGFNSSGAVQLKTEWIDDTKNISEYQLDLQSNNSQFILEVDVGGVGNAGESPAGIHSGWAPGLMPHYKIGVIATTTKGYRLIMWSSFYTHSNIPATKRDYGSWGSLTFPSPWEQVRWDGNKNLWERHRFDVQAYIHQLEPDNTLISIDKFIATGGNLDNITLKSN